MEWEVVELLIILLSPPNGTVLISRWFYKNWPVSSGAEPSAAPVTASAIGRMMLLCQARASLQCLTAFQAAIGQNKVQCSLRIDTFKPSSVVRR
jgi:hypothetical protein